MLIWFCVTSLLHSSAKTHHCNVFCFRLTDEMAKLDEIEHELEAQIASQATIIAENSEGQSGKQRSKQLLASDVDADNESSDTGESSWTAKSERLNSFDSWGEANTSQNLSDCDKSSSSSDGGGDSGLPG